VRLVCAAWKAVYDALATRLVLRQTTDEGLRDGSWRSTAAARGTKVKKCAERDVSRYEYAHVGGPDRLPKLYPSVSAESHTVMAHADALEMWSSIALANARRPRSLRSASRPFSSVLPCAPSTQRFGHSLVLLLMLLLVDMCLLCLYPLPDFSSPVTT
jgi:hypothetical protein